MRARAIWLLSDLGTPGLRKVRQQLKDDREQIRIAAYRALRRNGQGLIALSKKWQRIHHQPHDVKWLSAMRDLPYSQAKDVLISLAETYDGEDRHYLEALGTGATGKEASTLQDLLQNYGSEDSIQWLVKPSPKLPGVCILQQQPRPLQKGLNPTNLLKKNRTAALVALAYTGQQASHRFHC